MDLYGGIEAGGTKFVCAVASGPDDIRAETRFPTTTPVDTIAKAAAFFRQFIETSDQYIRAIGIGAFGPLDLDPASSQYGSITTTPKPNWGNTQLLAGIQEKLQLPTSIDTDVNAAALGEGRWGAAQDLSDYIYLTIGTGIGGGAIVHGNPVHGIVHPEMGHILLPHDLERDPFKGSCPYHGDCFEGLANGPAIEQRWGQPGPTLPEDHPAWPLEAHYIALALHSLICTLSPQRIILGGGVMEQRQLFPMVRSAVKISLNGYVSSPAVLENIDQYIVPPQLGARAGVLGAIALAMQQDRQKT